MARDLSGWLANQIGPVVFRVEGVDQTPASAINFEGFTSAFGTSGGLTELTLTPGSNGAGLAATVGPEDSGAGYIADGVADDVQISAAISALNLLGGGTVRLLPGTYVISSPIVGKSNVILEGAGAGCTKIALVVGFSDEHKYAIIAAGEATTGTSMPLTGNVAINAQSLGITASVETAALSHGDHLFLRATTSQESVSLAGSERYIGEFVKVMSVVSNTVHIFGTVRDSYLTAASARCYRISFVENFGVRDFEIYQLDAQNTRENNASMVAFTLTKNCFAERVYIHDNDGPGITIQQSIGTHVSGCRIQDLSNWTEAVDANAFGYGVLIGGASEGIVVNGNLFENVRHAVDAGPQGGQDSETAGYGVPRDVVVSNNIALRTTSAAFTTHSDGRGWLWIGNRASNCFGYGMTMRGRDMVVTGNVVEYCGGGIQLGDTSYNTSGGSGSSGTIRNNVVRHIKAFASSTQYDTLYDPNAGDGQGIVTGQTDNIVVEGNLIEYTDLAGIYIGRAARRSIFRNNTILNANTSGTSSIGAIEIQANYRDPTVTLTHSGSTTTLAGIGTVNASMVGRNIIVSGMTNPGNNGTFIVATAVTGANTLTYSNPSGVNTDSGSMWVEGSTHNVIEGNIARNNAASDYDPSATAGQAAYLIRDLGVEGNIQNRYLNNTGIGMVTGILSVIADAFAEGNSAGGGTTTISALAIDWSFGATFSKTLSAGGNTFTFSNAFDGNCIVVTLTGAASTVTWPTVLWPGGVAPTQTASGTDVYTFVKRGANIFGSVQQAFA